MRTITVEADDDIASKLRAIEREVEDKFNEGAASVEVLYGTTGFFPLEMH